MQRGAAVTGKDHSWKVTGGSPHWALGTQGCWQSQLVSRWASWPLPSPWDQTGVPLLLGVFVHLWVVEVSRRPRVGWNWGPPNPSRRPPEGGRGGYLVGRKASSEPQPCDTLGVLAWGRGQEKDCPL